jgi:type II secretory pathway pseudopilin PulG
MKIPRHHAGFSLVETLVAMFIFILAVGVLAESASIAINGLVSYEIKEGSDRDFQFVRDQVLTISDTDSLSMGGRVQTPNAGDGEWQLVESQTTDTPDFFQITINITLSGNDSVPPQSATQSMMVLRPQWSQTDQRSDLESAIHDNLANWRTQQSWP